MIRIVDKCSGIILSEMKESKQHSCFNVGSSITLFASNKYIVKKLVIDPFNPKDLKIIVEKEGTKVTDG